MKIRRRDYIGAGLIVLGAAMLLLSGGLLAAIPMGEGVDHTFTEGVLMTFTVVSFVVAPVFAVVGVFLIADGR